MKKIFAIFLTIALLMMVIIGASCHDSEETLSGELPTLEIGDKWVYRMISEGIEYKMTLEVTGEDVINGKNCYVRAASFEPPVRGIFDSIIAKLDKATMSRVSGQMSGEYQGTSFITPVTFSSEFPDGLPYPYEVGKKYKQIETETTTTTANGETNAETEIYTYIFKMERIEEITVPAGTFKCFKIVKYDETGTNVILTMWTSDETKQYEVKSINHESGDTTELLSYSMHYGNEDGAHLTLDTYTNQYYGFSIDFPEGWQVDESSKQADVAFLGPDVEYSAFTVNINVIVQEYPNVLTLDDYVTAVKAQLERMDTSVEILEEGTTTINGEEAYVLVMQSYDDQYDITFKAKWMAIVKGTTCFAVTYDATGSSYNNYLEYGNRAIKSFKLNL